MFSFIEKTARAAVDLTCDTAEMALGGDGPKRDDVAQMLAAGMTVAAIAVAFDVTEDIVRELAE